MIRRWAGAALAAALLAGCGAPDDGPVRAAATEWLAAAADRDAAALCRLLTPAAAESVPTGDRTCEQAVADLELPGDGPVGTVEVWSDRAQVKAGADTLFLTRVAAGWRVSGAGCEFQGDEPYDCDVAG